MEDAVHLAFHTDANGFIPLDNQGIADEPPLSLGRKPDGEIKVLQETQGSFESPDLFERGAADRHNLVEQEESRCEHFPRIEPLTPRNARAKPCEFKRSAFGLAIQVLRFRVAHTTTLPLASLFHQLHLLANLVRQPKVVRIEERDNFAHGFANTAVPGCRRSGILLPDYLDAVTECAQNLQSRICGTIVHNDHFDFTVSLT
jgi:hypothetical protein